MATEENDTWPTTRPLCRVCTEHEWIYLGMVVSRTIIVMRCILLAQVNSTAQVEDFRQAKTYATRRERNVLWVHKNRFELEIEKSQAVQM